jgi:DNA-binding MarR family transcriptional regulator
MRHDAAVQAIELVARATVDVTTRALAEATPGLDLSLLQWRALLIVGEDPAGVRVGQVGDGVGAPLPAASRLVQRLKRRGLVHVERDPDDGRATRVRLTDAGLHARSTVLARRRHIISEALHPTVLPAEAVQGLRVVAERFEQLSRETPARETGPTVGPERETMNETETTITETGTPIAAGEELTPMTETGTPIAAGEELTPMTETGTPMTETSTGSFAAGEETTPEEDAEHRSQHLGSFAAGDETTPDKDADERSLHLGTFAAGEERTPVEDAEERSHPGTFADTEPQAEPTAEPTA